MPFLLFNIQEKGARCVRVLQALNDRGRRIIPSNMTLKELDELRKKTFYCPICKEKVIFRHGPKVIPHFAHQRTSTCTAAKTNESVTHKRAKLQLFHWLQKQQFPVQLEKYFPAIKQRSDVYVEDKQRKLALEFQSTVIQTDDFRRRSEGYKAIGLTPVWLIDRNCLKTVLPFTYRISSRFLPLIETFPEQEPSKLLFYSAEQKRLTILTDIHFVTATKLIAFPQDIPLHEASLDHFFLNRAFPPSTLLKLWLKEKRHFRLASYPVYRRERQFRKWLYEKGFYIEQLPAAIHLPIRLQHKMNVPIWQWQTKLVLNVLHPLPIGNTIHVNRCVNVLLPFVNGKDPNIAREVFREYMKLLTAGKWFKRKDDNVWLKVRYFRFYRYIEEAVAGDERFMRHLAQEMMNDVKRKLHE